MDSIKLYINKVLKPIITITSSSKWGNMFDKLPIHKQAIVTLDIEIRANKVRLKEVQDTLRQVIKYDARNMSLTTFMKMKARL